MTGSSPAEDPASGLDTSVAHSARLWNYLLGGKDNFGADRATWRCATAPTPTRR
jgi:hypothetical protein